MPISDNDLQVLEEWLDGELPEEQGEALRRRMSMEPELSLALNRLRDERQVRSRFFTLLEPTDQEIEVQMAESRRSVRHEDVWASRVRGLQKIASVAAGIVLVFMAGWISRERLQVKSEQPSNGFVRVPGNLPLGDGIQAAGMGAPDPGQLRFTNYPGNVDLTKVPVAANVDEKRQVYLLQDASGRFFVLQGIDPRALQQRVSPQLIPAPRPQQPQGQGILVNEERPLNR